MKSSSFVKTVLLSGILFLSGFVSTNNVALAQDSNTYINPTIEGYRLDWCLHWADQCGKPAADAWCAKKMGKADGYAQEWKAAEDIGASSPTYVIGDGKICDQEFCDGFQSITCVALTQDSNTYINPTIEGYRLDWCLHWADQCGKPAADAWCAKKMGKADGYAKEWKAAEDIGASSPTYVMGDGKICDQEFCDGFQSITCGYSTD